MIKIGLQLQTLIALVWIGAVMVIATPAQAPIVPSERQEVVVFLAGQDAVSPVIRVVIGSPAPFLSIAAGWRHDPSRRFTLYLRCRPDGQPWGEWIALAIDPDTLEVDSAAARKIVEAETREIQFRLVWEDGTVPVVPFRLDIDIVNPGVTPKYLQDGYLKKMSENEEVPGLRVTGGLGRPPVVTRTEWGCPDGQGTSRPPVSYTTVTHLIVHHTVNDNGSSDWAAVVRSIWNFHFYDRGYIDIGYNYLIDPNGIIYEGRSGGDNVQGAHFSGVNAGTMGVAMLGTFTGTVPTVKAMASLRRLLAWKADQRGLIAYRATAHAASGMVLKVVSGHRDGPGSTECPGELLYAMLPRLRAEVHNERAGAGLVTAVSAASYATAPLARESIVAVYGVSLATRNDAALRLPLPESLAGTSVRLIDRLDREFTAQLFYVSPSQVNLLLPAGLADGPATILVENEQGLVAAGSLEIGPLAPAIFTANSNGTGVPAALLLRIRSDQSTSYEPVSRFDETLKQYVPLKIDPGPDSDQLYLAGFGTGMRAFRDSGGVSTSITATLGDIDLPVTFVGPAPGYAGLDQFNLNLAAVRRLAGRGDLTLRLVVDGKAANPVLLKF